jgi:hypothetical protein
MRCRPIDLVSFWLMPWSAPFRHACVWVTRLGAPLQGKQPDKDAPNWLRPLCVQRWVGQAVAARLAWLAAHPEVDAWRFGHESEPAWVEAAYARYDWRCLRAFTDSLLLWLFGMEVERLARIAQEAPALVGSGEWTRAALGAFEHIAQIYAELKRRHKAMQARALLREDLRACITWQAPRQNADVPDAGGAPADASEPAAAVRISQQEVALLLHVAS